jgi:hypothetical protein
MLTGLLQALKVSTSITAVVYNTYKGELTGLCPLLLHDEISPHIRSFRQSALLLKEYSSNTEHLYSPSNAVLNPIARQSVGRPCGALSERRRSAR